MKKRLPLLIIFLVCLVFFIPFFLKPKLLTIKDNDLGRTYIPIFNFFRNSFYKYKQIPLWRSDQMMGESLIANPLSTVFYPLNIIFILFPVNFGAVFYLFVHFFLAAIFTFFLARSFKLSPLSSLSAAFFYAFSTKMILHLSAGHITMIAAFSWFPLAFLSLRKIIN